MPDNIPNYPMTEVIASQVYNRRRPDGVQTTINVEVGIPALVAPGYFVRQYWYCPYRITGIQADVYDGESLGVTSLTALGMTLSTIAPLLLALPYASELELFTVPNLGLPLFPMPIPGHHAQDRK